MTLAEAESLFQQGKFDEAANVFRSLAAEDDLACLPRFRLGQVLFRNKRFGEAAAIWNELYNVLDGHPGQLRQETEQLGPDVITLEGLLPFGTSYPIQAQICCLMGDAHLGQEDWQRGLNNYSTAINLSSTCWAALKGMAQCHIKLREYDRARRELLDYLEENPRDAKAYRLLAMVAKANGWYEQQMNLLHCALLIHPGHTKSLESVGKYLEQRSRFDEAIKLYRAAMERIGESVDLANHIVRINLARSRQAPNDLGALRNAIDALERTLHLDPNQTQMQVMLANLRDVYNLHQSSASLSQVDVDLTASSISRQTAGPVSASASSRTREAVAEVTPPQQPAKAPGIRPRITKPDERFGRSTLAGGVVTETSAGRAATAPVNLATGRPPPDVAANPSPPAEDGHAPALPPPPAGPAPSATAGQNAPADALTADELDRTGDDLRLSDMLLAGLTKDQIAELDLEPRGLDDAALAAEFDEAEATESITGQIPGLGSGLRVDVDMGLSASFPAQGSGMVVVAGEDSPSSVQAIGAGLETDQSPPPPTELGLSASMMLATPDDDLGRNEAVELGQARPPSIDVVGESSEGISAVPDMDQADALAAPAPPRSDEPDPHAHALPQTSLSAEPESAGLDAVSMGLDAAISPDQIAALIRAAQLSQTSEQNVYDPVQRRVVRSDDALIEPHAIAGSMSTAPEFPEVFESQHVPGSQADADAASITPIQPPMARPRPPAPPPGPITDYTRGRSAEPAATPLEPEALDHDADQPTQSSSALSRLRELLGPSARRMARQAQPPPAQPVLPPSPAPQAPRGALAPASAAQPAAAPPIRTQGSGSRTAAMQGRPPPGPEADLSEEYARLRGGPLELQVAARYYRVDLGQLRAPLKRAATGRRGLKAELKSYQQLKQERRQRRS